MDVEKFADQPSSEHGLPLRFGAGLYHEEEGWRWMGPSGNIHVEPGALPARVRFDVACAPAALYDRFPFTLNIRLGRKTAERVTFQSGGEVRSVQLALGEMELGEDLRLESDESFVPAAIGFNSDTRRLSVRVRNLHLQPGEGRDCPACGRSCDGAKMIGPLNRTGDSPGRNYDLVECPACGLIYLSPLPLKQEFDDLYINSTQFDSDVYTGERAQLVVEFFQDRLAAICSHLGAAKLRVLEIGSGLSWMCRAAKIQDPSAITIAQDISHEAMSVCSWVDRFCLGELENVKDQLAELGPYHIISMTHVIEHLTEPTATLALCRELLRPDGYIFITAPFRPLEWEPVRSMTIWESWSYNHVPAHLQYFHAHSMKRCAERAKLNMCHFSDREDHGQALEAWLTRH
jgi:hypothetical protein